MLYRRATCLVALTITLLFTTSKAGFNIKKGKSTMKQLFSEFIAAALNNECKDLRDLISFTNRLVSDDKGLKPYLSEIALDSNTCQIMLSKINRYEKKFEEILDGAGIQLKQVSDETGIQDELDHIPLFGKIQDLRSLCEFRPTTSKMAPTTSGGTGTSLRVLFRKNTSLRVLLRTESNPVSEFKIKEGIKEVQLMLDAFLQLALDKNCDNLESLIKFAESMVNDTELYKAVSRAASQHNDLTIINAIGTYRIDFHHILIIEGREYGTILPMKEKLDLLYAKCM